MKKLCALLLLGITLPSFGESVTAVNFNPSRLGDFQMLKVSSQAILRGGLKTDAFYVNSGGTVSMTNQTTQNFYTVPNVLMDTNATAAAVNVPNAIFRSPYYLYGNCDGNGDNCTQLRPSAGKFLPDAAEISFSAGTRCVTLSGTEYCDGSGFLYRVRDIVITGGTASGSSLNFTGDSLIKQLNSSTMLWLRATNSATVWDTLTISGNNGVSSAMFGGVDNISFKLTGQKIPYPNSTYLKHYNSSGTEVPASAPALSGLQLRWVPRKPYGTSTTVYVLALVKPVTGPGFEEFEEGRL